MSEPFLFDPTTGSKAAVTTAEPEPARPIPPQVPAPAPEPAPEPARKAPARKPAASGGDGDLIALIAERVAPNLKVTEESVRSAVRDYVSSLGLQSSVTVTARTATAPASFTMSGTHRLFGPIMQLLGEGLHVALIGAPGGGKTHLAYQVADAWKKHTGAKRSFYVALDETAPVEKLVGFLDANGQFRVPLADFLKCAEEGGLAIFDEIGNSNPSLILGIQSILSNSHFTDGNGRAFQVHPDFRVLVLDNTALNGGSRGHEFRKAVDLSFKDRFFFVEFTYDEDLEERLTMAENPKARPWLEWTRKVRAHLAATATTSRLCASPRTAVAGARALRTGLDVSMVANGVFFRGADAATRNSILAACPLPKM